ncbi:13241_t:CDS:2 [Cetraspora pellucida]|uniref:13241_t:CDS:1 n=1 Tax=Cetraspora pellucida TaxID=1433469 RepID=A0A9N9GXX3_9GLOM|nr:13241_t:CDS:2 [Cetraspora pellucida]
MTFYNDQKKAIERALKELENSPTTSNRKIAKRFGISEAILRYVIKNKGPLNCPGPAKVLTNYEEQQLVSYCLNMQKLGFGLTRSGVNHCFMKIVNKSKRPHPFNKTQRANPIIVQDHFNKLQKIIKENSLTPDRIWNMVETGFILNPELCKVIAKKGAWQVYQVSHSNSNEHISVCPTISTARSYILSLIIYKGKRMIPDLLEETGYMWESLFQKYIEHFIRLIPPARSVLLILDEHKSHLKTIYHKDCEQLHINNNEEIITKHLFAKVLGLAYLKTYTPLAICNAFKATRIWPFNLSAISSDCLDPLLVTKQPDFLSTQSTSSPSTNILLTQSIPLLSTTAASSSQPPPKSSSNNIYSFTTLRSEVKDLSERVKELEAELKATKKELKTLKHPDTSSLKKHKTMPFAQLLTNEASLKALSDAEEEAEKKANEIKLKKESVA